jgi:hypothetical protein
MPMALARILLTSTWVALAAPAFANGQDAQVTVTAVPATATLSRGAAQAGYAAYLIQVKNVSDDTLKILKITGNTSVTPAPPATTAGTADFVRKVGQGTDVSCVTTSGPTAIECTIVPLLPPYQSISFVVLFKTPTSGASIKFSTKTLYAEYEHHEPYFDDIESIYKSAVTALAAPSATQLESYVPDTGATLSTGATGDAVPTATDPWTTTIAVPGNNGTTLSVSEAIDPNSCGPGVLTCNVSAIALPGSFTTPVLIITLRRDVSTIGSATTYYSSRHYYKPPEPNIKNAVIEYKHVPTGTFVPVQNCARDYYGQPIVTPGLPGPGVPCIAKRKAYPKKSPTPIDLRGDWEFEIWAVDNGQYRG